MGAIDLIGIVIAVIAITFAYMKWRYQYWQRKNVPVIPKLDTSNLTVNEQAALDYKYGKSKGWRYYGAYSLFAFPLFTVTDLDLLKKIMTKDFDHFVDRGVYVNEKLQPISAHLFAIGGTKWKNLRPKFTAIFTTKNMKSMFKTVVRVSEHLVKRLEEVAEAKKPADIKSVLVCYTIDVIGACGFSLEFNSFKDPNSPLLQFDNKIFKHSAWKMTKEIFCNYFPDMGRLLGFTLIDEEVDTHFNKMIDDTVDYRETKKVIRNDFLQMMLEIKENEETGGNGDGTSLTLDEIVAQCFVFFVGGFETSTTTMTFALLELSAHQDVQEKAREEVLEVLSKHGDEITYESLKEMEYLRQVVDEALRKYAPIGKIERVCTADYKIPDSDLVLEKGTRVVIPIHGIHYDDEHYKNPNLFDPERFSKENKQKRHPYAHIPFGEGPRMCLGMMFGILETMVGLATVLRSFRVKLSERTKYPIKLDPEYFFPRTQGGTWLDVEKI